MGELRVRSQCVGVAVYGNCDVWELQWTSCSETSSYEQQCGFSTQFSFQYFSYFTDDMFPLNCSIDFQLISLDFAIDFCYFYNVVTDIWIDRSMDRIMDRQTK